MDPRTLELLRLLQSGPYDESGLKAIRELLRTQRRALRAQKDAAALTELIELLEAWSQAAENPRFAADALREAGYIAERDLQQPERAAQLRALATARTSIPVRRPAPKTTPKRSLDAQIAACERAIDADPDVEIVRKLADLLSERAAPGDAEQAADLYFTLAEVIGPPQAVSLLERALALAPNHAAARELLASCAGSASTSEPSPAKAGSPASQAHVRAQAAAQGAGAASEPRRASGEEPKANLAVPPLTAAEAGPLTAAADAPAAPLPSLSVPPAAGSAVASARGAAVSLRIVPPQATAQTLVIPSAGSTAEPSGLGIHAPSIESGPHLGRISAPPPAIPVPARSAATPEGLGSSLSPVVMSDAPAAPVRAGGGRRRVQRMQLAAGVLALGALAATSVLILSPRTRQSARGLFGIQATSLPKAAVSSGPSQPPAPTDPLADSLERATTTAATAHGSGSGTTAAQAAPGAAIVPPAAVPSVGPPSVEATAGRQAATGSTAPPDRAPGSEQAQAVPNAEPTARQVQGSARSRRAASGPSVLALLDSLSVRGGRLHRSRLAKALDKATAKIERCYEEALQKKPRMRGRLVFAWKVRRNGHVAGVKRLGGSIHDAQLVRCSAAAIAETRFPRPRKRAARLKLPLQYHRS